MSARIRIRRKMLRMNVFTATTKNQGSNLLAVYQLGTITCSIEMQLTSSSVDKFCSISRSTTDTANPASISAEPERKTRTSERPCPKTYMHILVFDDLSNTFFTLNVSIERLALGISDVVTRSSDSVLLFKV